jgi:hypothetical protein
VTAGVLFSDRRYVGACLLLLRRFAFGPVLSIPVSLNL